MLKSIAKKKTPGVKFGKVDLQRHRELGQLYSVKSIPDTRIYIDGKQSAEFVGVRGKDFIENLVAKGLSRLHDEPAVGGESPGKGATNPAGIQIAPIQRTSQKRTLPSGIEWIPVP